MDDDVTGDQGRFADPGWTTAELLSGTVLIECPTCRSRAQVVARRPANKGFGPRRLSCGECAYVADHDGNEWIVYEDGRDPWFGLPLWYRKQIALGVLWAYNEDHLEALRDYVLADLRERQKSESSGWANQSIFSRLPSWMKKAQNRKRIAAALDDMRHR